MYITGKYWNNYIGDTDDSLTLIEHLMEKQKKEIPLAEIFRDFGLDKLEGNFKSPEISLEYTDAEGWETPIYYAIDLVTDLAALLLECKVNGSVDLNELGGENDSPQTVTITATSEEHALMNKALADFAADPLSYDLSDMVPKDELLEMAALCQNLRAELYGTDR